MRKKRTNIVYIHHIQDAIEKIAQYISKHTYSELLKNEWDQDAIVRNLEIIGEAANNLEPSFRDRFSEVPWREIIDFRNVVAHDYADLDLEVVWQIIASDLPRLGKQIENIVRNASE